MGSFRNLRRGNDKSKGMGVGKKQDTSVNCRPDFVEEWMGLYRCDDGRHCRCGPGRVVLPSPHITPCSRCLPCRTLCCESILHVRKFAMYLVSLGEGTEAQCLKDLPEATLQITGSIQTWMQMFPAAGLVYRDRQSKPARGC